MIVERSADGRPAVVADEMSQVSKAENRMDVEMPPKRRPKNRTGMEGMLMHAHAKV